MEAMSSGACSGVAPLLCLPWQPWVVSPASPLAACWKAPGKLSAACGMGAWVWACALPLGLLYICDLQVCGQRARALTGGHWGSEWGQPGLFVKEGRGVTSISSAWGLMVWPTGEGSFSALWSKRSCCAHGISNEKLVLLSVSPVLVS